jgi:F-type H+-transporting ATPase subunit b
MGTLNSIIVSLGIDPTLWIQLGVFLVTYSFLKIFVFNPYFAAFESRQGQTQGNQEKAEEILAQTRELEMLYQRKARGHNAEIKELFDNARTDASKEQDRLQAEAREQARKTIEAARAKIEEQYNIAREQLIKQTPELSKVITERLLPSEVN